MRADERALIALDAVFGDPLGNLDRDAALFKLRGSGGNGAVRAERGGGELVSLEDQDGMNDIAEIFVIRHLDGFRPFGRIRPGCGNLDLYEVRLCGFDRAVIHLHDGVALLREGLVSHLFHEFLRFFVRHDAVVDEEERGLQDGVGSAAEPQLAGDCDRVDHVEFRFLGREFVLDGGGEIFLQLFDGHPGCVQEEFALLLEVGDHVVTRHVGRVVAGDEIRRVDEVGGLNGRLAESQVRDGDAARLLGVVEEISLRVHIGVVADDLDGVLVRAYRAVRAEAVEFAADGPLGRGVILLGEIQRSMRQIVVDTDGEVIFRLFLLEVLVDGVDHGGVELLGAEAVTAAVNLDIRHALFEERGADVEI